MAATASDQCAAGGPRSGHALCAGRAGSTAVAQLLIQAAPQTLHIATTQHMLPLHISCANGQAEMTRLLLAAAPEAAAVRGASDSLPIHMAAECGNADVVANNRQRVCDFCREEVKRNRRQTVKTVTTDRKEQIKLLFAWGVYKTTVKA